MAKIFSALTLVVAALAIYFGLESKNRITKIKEVAEVEHADLLATKDTPKKTKDTLKETEDQLAATKTDLEKEKEAKRMVEADLDKTKTELMAKIAELDQANAKAVALQKAIDEMGAKPGEDPKVQIEAMKTQLADLETKNKELELVKAELTTRVETAEGQKKEAEQRLAVADTEIKKYRDGVIRQGLSGQILAVNAGWGFVVLSIGDREGAVANKTLVVTRGGQSIGRVRITNVERSQSVADIIPSSFVRGTYPSPGDGVIFQREEKTPEAAAEVANNTGKGAALPELPLR